MRKLKSLAYLFIAASLLFTSCGGDDEETDPIAPTVSLTSSSPITGDVTKASSDTLTFIIDLRQGDANLETLTIREGAGSAAPTALFSYSVSELDGSAIDYESDGNYEVKDNAILTVKVDPKGNTGTFTYVFGLTDKDGVSATPLEITVTISDGELASYTATMIEAPGSGETSKAFYSSSNNTTYGYDVAEADEAIQSLIDFGYRHEDGAELISPSEYIAGSGTNNAAKDDWTNTNTTMFKSTTAVFADATVASLNAMDFSTGTTTAISKLSVGDVYAFKTEAGKVGIFEVKEIDGTFNPGDSMTIDIKVIK